MHDATNAFLKALNLENKHEPIHKSLAAALLEKAWKPITPIPTKGCKGPYCEENTGLDSDGYCKDCGKVAFIKKVTDDAAKINPDKKWEPLKNTGSDRDAAAEKEEREMQDGRHTLAGGSMWKSLGARVFEEQLFKSPRRPKDAEPHPNMPAEMHPSWRAYAGVHQSVMKKWKNSDHEMHHAYLAKKWDFHNTAAERYGNPNFNQHSEEFKNSTQGRHWWGQRDSAHAQREQFGQQIREHLSKIEGVQSMKHVSDVAKTARDFHMQQNKVPSFLNYDTGVHAITAMAKHQVAGKMSEKDQLRFGNFKQNFHDAADAHEEKTGSYDGFKFELAHVHPKMLELAHEAMRSSNAPEHAETKNIIRHANDAAYLHNE